MIATGSGAVRDRPTGDGWRRVAAAIHAIQQEPAPVLLTVVASGAPPMWLDFSSGRYYWEPPLDDLPASPGEVRVYSQPIDPDNPPYPWVAWRAMDPLLWEIGHHAFADARADWMRETDRIALQRWPNLTELPHAAEEIRLIATLANGYLPAQELGLLSGVDEATAQRTLDKLSLLGAVKTATGPHTAPGVVTGPAAGAREPSGGQDGGQRFPLFSKLRDRFGGGR